MALLVQLVLLSHCFRIFLAVPLKIFNDDFLLNFLPLFNMPLRIFMAAAPMFFDTLLVCLAFFFFVSFLSFFSALVRSAVSAAQR